MSRSVVYLDVEALNRNESVKEKGGQGCEEHVIYANTFISACPRLTPRAALAAATSQTSVM